MNSLDPKLYLQAYTKFAEARFADRSCDLSFIDYSQYKFSARPKLTDGTRYFFRTGAEDYVIEIINDIHDLRRYLHDASVWQSILAEYSEDDRFLLNIEFIEVPTAYALTRPYALKNRFIYSMARLGAMYQMPKRFTAVTPENRINFEAMKRLVADWDGFTSFSDALDLLNSAKYVDSTSDFRHSDSHRIPANLEFGLAAGSRIQEVAGRAALAISHTDPIKVADILPPIREQCDCAVRCLDAFWMVVVRRDASWKGARSSCGTRGTRAK